MQLLSTLHYYPHKKFYSEILKKILKKESIHPILKSKDEFSDEQI